jgi:hypothetical protein
MRQVGVLLVRLLRPDPTTVFLVVLLASVAMAPPALASPAQASTFCADDPDHLPDTPPVLRPVDEAPLHPGFLRFRNELKDIARRRDERALMQVVDPEIRISFVDNNGIDNFRKLVRGGFGQPASQFWSDFARMLDLGGTLREDGHGFIAPYIYSAWPNHYDSLECSVVVGANVHVREQPHANARIVATVSYAIVKLHSSPDLEWTAVELADGGKGYVAARYVYGPTGWRAFFDDENGRWRMTLFIAGD